MTNTLDPLETSLQEILFNRKKIIEDYIRFWMAVQIPDADLTPKYLAENLVLRNDGTGRLWMDFKNEKDREIEGYLERCGPAAEES